MPSPPSAPPRALETLLAGLIDYAGLFPPAALDMPAAVAEFAEARASDDRAVLARFVLPAARLPEFGIAASQIPSARGWRLSALLSDDLDGELDQIGATNAWFRATGAAHEVDSVELRASTPAHAVERLARIPQTLARFVEFPATELPEPFLAALDAAGAKAKLRMGGVTAEAFPAAEHVVRFVAACVRRGIAFKATAGLHHPLRGAYRLTYAPGADLASMYGFLNLFLVAALLRAGGTDDEARALLVEHDLSAFRITADVVQWRAHRFDHAALDALRQQSAVSIGSCSFREPLDDLHALGFR